MSEPTPNDARLVAELQALTLALHIGGLDGLRNGSVALRTVAPTPEEQHSKKEWEDA